MQTFKLKILSFIVIILIYSDHSYCQWNQITFPYNDNLRMVRFVSENLGWVIGDDYVYKTIDGGDNWQTQDALMGGGCEAFFAIDTLTAIYADHSLRGIRRTSDGGATWSTVNNDAYYYYEFNFINDDLGFAACGSASSIDSGFVRRSLDGGKHWATIASVYFPNAAYDFDGISFVDSLNGWAVSYKGWVYNTTDGGFTWSFQDSVGRSNSPEREFVPCRDIQFTSLDSGWVVGGFAGEALVAKTTDGGQLWFSEILMPFSLCSIREIEMINSQVGWFAGANNGGAMLAKTIDGGNTWVDQLPSQGGFNSISMINSNIGYAVGDNGRIYKTINGGGPTGVNEHFIQALASFQLEQNYPNPFNPETIIEFSIPENSFVSLTIYDVLGNEVKTLVNQEKPAGIYQVSFYAKGLSSGIYFYELKSKFSTLIKKMILLR